MSRLRRVTASFTFSILVASFALALTSPVAASGGYTAPSNVLICRTLSAAEAALACLPDSRLKTYLAAQIDAAQLKNNCS
jgi:hypothetical protein